LTKFKGYLDRLRENVEALDEAIETARANSKGKKGSDSRTALQWAKTLRDLVEVRNTTLSNIKIHLLGRDETGAATEPPDHYNSNEQVMFEREFQTFLAPWTREDLKLECQDCSVSSEEVEEQEINTGRDRLGLLTSIRLNLCPACYARRKAKEPKENE
jgi:hypothetical protein